MITGAQQKPRNLLVVEDDPDTANLLKLYFSSHNYSVQVAPRGNEALDSARKQPPDLILLDILLPDMDGFQVCEALRRSPRSSYIPIIFLTEKSSPSDRLAGLSAGAQDYVTKPFDVEELRLRVHNLISRSEREKLVDARTSLPHSRLTDEQLQRVAGQAGWYIIEGKLQAFQIFRDVNGFVAGDDVLKFAGQTLREVVEQLGTPDDFIGHPADETFVIITHAADATTLANRLQERFNSGVLTYYSFMDREQGFVMVRDKNGEMVPAPLMTLATTIRPA